MKQRQAENQSACAPRKAGCSGAKIDEQGPDGHREPYIQKRLDTIAATVFSELLRERYSEFYLKAVGGNRKAAITSQCLECVGMEREGVRLCTDKGCPLYNLRPYKGKESQKGADDET